MKHIQTHWSSDNRILAKKLHDQVESELTTHWKNVWYRRLGFYFFEQEIRADITEKIESQGEFASHHLLDPEYQALLARSKKGNNIKYETWDELTMIVNDYIFAQGQFLAQDYGVADEKIIDIMIGALAQGSSPSVLSRQGSFMSDVILELRRARADVTIVTQIQEGKHTYQTLLKMCGEYIGTFACVPRFVDLYPTGWSVETLMAAVDDSARLDSILEPNYSLECATLSPEEVVPYGYVAVADTPYSTRFGKLGFRWAQRAWYIKLGISLMIVFVSLMVGGSTLVILPIVWGILAIARTKSQYLGIFHTLLTRWYTSYTDQRNQYVELYDTMVDPHQDTDDTVKAQQLMSCRFDVIPFAGHELMWDATDYAKRLYKYMMAFAADESVQKDVAMMDAISYWSSDHHLSLLVVQDGNYTEQALYRFEHLLQAMKKIVIRDGKYEQEYIAQYEGIDELISGKKYSFWFWTFRNALRDGAMVAISSGVLGWMGSYLWNRSIGGSTALAASPSIIVPTLTHSDDLFSHVELLTEMKTQMTIEEINQFFGAIKQGQSATLWDTMVDMFGYTKGNVYTNHLMDSWWRISDDQITSELFTYSLQGDFPVSADHGGWDSMMNFLHRIYNYDNLEVYTNLLDKPWLSQTLQDLQSGEMTISEFAQLPLEHREIITQALFYHLDADALQHLFDGGTIVIPQPIDPVVVQTGTIVDTGSQEHTLQLGDKILQWLGIHANTSGAVITGDVELPDMSGTGDVELPSVQLKDNVWQQFDDWKTNIGLSWNNRFARPSFDGLIQWAERLGTSLAERFTRPQGSTPDVPSVDLTGSIDMPDDILTGTMEPPVLTTGDIALTGDVQSTGFWSDFRTWLKGTAPEKVIDTQTGALIDTGVVDGVLSGLTSDELQLSETVIDHDALAPGQIAQFTVPIVRKDKIYE